MNLIRFQRLWKEAVSGPLPEDRVLGPWVGSWLSEPSGHTGSLRCIVRDVDSESFRAAFHAVYWKVFWMTYEPRLDCHPVADGYQLRGAWKLPGPFGGEFAYEGIVTPSAFRARYRSVGDHGTFELRRPRRTMASGPRPT